MKFEVRRWPEILTIFRNRNTSGVYELAPSGFEYAPYIYLPFEKYWEGIECVSLEPHSRFGSLSIIIFWEYGIRCIATTVEAVLNVLIIIRVGTSTEFLAKYRINPHASSSSRSTCFIVEAPRI